MRKLKIAVLFGGCSPEYGVSLQSAGAVLRHIDRDKYDPLPIGITRQGQWYCYPGGVDRIENDTWREDEGLRPAVLSPDRGTHGLLLSGPAGVDTLYLDGVFPVLHGRNGEDGTVQGLAALAGVPVVGCGALASALCMDKDMAHRLARAAGVAVPEAVVLENRKQLPLAAAFAQRAGYPLFVKPVRAGSSLGVAKVSDGEALARAIPLAFRYDSRVMVEKAVPGFEVGCAVMGTDRLLMGELDEIELSGGFFDFTEKYTLQSAAIHVPARIGPETARRVKRTAGTVYRALNCAGFARVDMFLTPEGDILFNEINTIPGFTEHSRFPAMMEAAGYSFGQVLDCIIGQAVRP